MKSKKQVIFTIFLTFLILVSFISGNAFAHSAYWADLLTGQRIDTLKVSSGENIQLILKVEVPEKKNLRAYCFSLTYDHTLTSLNKALAAKGSSFPPRLINTRNPGEVIINSFNISGVKGLTTISLLDIFLTAVNEGSFKLAIEVKSFGSSGNDIFLPTPEDILINIISSDYDNDKGDDSISTTSTKR